MRGALKNFAPSQHGRVPRLNQRPSFSISAKIVITLAVTSIAGCGESTYTLYRNSVTDEGLRIHVSTFNANEGEGYNRGNCEIARELFQNQDGVKVRFLCEKGRFRR
jgi:hypothetical protein